MNRDLTATLEAWKRALSIYDVTARIQTEINLIDAPVNFHSIRPNAALASVNLEDSAGFVRWNLRAACHHNYTIGAAILKKKASWARIALRAT